MRLALATVILVAAAEPVFAATYHVSNTGTGSVCTLAQPCREIRTALALAALAPNDTIEVGDGSYLGFDVDDIHGAPGAPITIHATGTGALVTITIDRADNRDTIFITFSSYIVIDGLRAFNANRAAVRIDESPNVTVRNGVFGNNGTWGIFTDFSDDLLLEDNECFGSGDEHGIYVSNSGDRPVVRGNLIHDNVASGIQLNADLSAGGDGIITGALIENNFIWNNGAIGGAAINLDGVQDSTVRNNVLWNNHATGIVNYMGDGAEGPRGMQILHNTVDQPTDGRWALLMWNTTGTNLVRNNILYTRHAFRGSITYLDATDVANTDSDYNVIVRVTPDDDNNIYTLAEWQALGHEPNSISATAAALFVDPNLPDYHLATGSPAIDEGQTLAAVTVDIEDNVRPAGPASDIGAYEVAAPVVVPTISVADASGAEGAGPIMVSVTLSQSTTATVTVVYGTSDTTAVAGTDYTAAAGTLTFTPGVTLRTFAVAVTADALDEPSETLDVTLSSPVNGTLGDGSAVVTIVDDDPTPTVSIADAAVVEGASGTATLSFPVTLSAASGQTVTVDWTTSGGTASAGVDYTAASGTVTFAPGATAATVAVTVNGDVTVELDETVAVTLSAPANATLGDASAIGTIVDDDAASLANVELGHGSLHDGTLAAIGGVPDTDYFHIAQKPYASYELLVEDVSGDVTPLSVTRLGADNATVVQTATAVGTGASVAMRWVNDVPATIVNQHIRVMSGSGGCTSSCGSDDVYRIRVYETTSSVPRFNNAGSQITVMVLQNGSPETIAGRAWFWSPAGVLLESQSFTLAPHAALVLNTATLPTLVGRSGAVTVSHNGTHGGLAGKTVALEPSTGFSFDSPLLTRLR